MAVIAGEVRVAQGEDGEVVAVQDELVVTEGQDGGQARLERRERVLIAVPDEDGNVAIAEHVRVQAIEVGEMPPPAPDPPPTTGTTRQPIRPQPRPHPPRQQQPRQQPPAPRQTTPATRTTDRTLLLPRTNPPPRNRKKRLPIHLSGCLFCSLAYFLSGAILVGLSLAYVWPCPPLKPAAGSIAAFGVVTILVACTCCCFVFQMRGQWAVLLSAIVGALFTLALAVAAVETSYGLINEHKFYQNHTRIKGCNRYDEDAFIPAALVVASYALLGLTFFYFIGTCLNAITGRHPRPFLYK